MSKETKRSRELEASEANTELAKRLRNENGQKQTRIDHVMMANSLFRKSETLDAMICTICFNRIKIHFKGKTYYKCLTDHLYSRHRTKYWETLNECGYTSNSFPTPNNANERAVSKKLNMTQRRKIALNITLGIYETNTSPNVLKNRFLRRGFDDMVASGISAYPSPPTVRKYGKLINEKMKELKSNDIKSLVKSMLIPRATAYCDLYKDFSGRHILGLSICITDRNSLQPKLFFLGVNEFKESHTSALLSSEIIKILHAHSILPTKATDATSVLHALVTDNANNMLSTSNNLWLYSQPCLSHQLHLIVMEKIGIKLKNQSRYKVMDENDDTIDDEYETILNGSSYLSNLQRIVTQTKILSSHFHRSNMKQKWMKYNHRKQGIPILAKILFTRWSSIFVGLEKHYQFINKNKNDFIQKYLETVPNIDEYLRGNIIGDPVGDRSLILELLSVMKPIQDLTLQLQQKNISIASALLNIHRCTKKLKANEIPIYNSELMLDRSKMDQSVVEFADNVANELRMRFQISSTSLSQEHLLAFFLYPYERKCIINGLGIRNTDKFKERFKIEFQSVAIKIGMKLEKVQKMENKDIMMNNGDDGFTPKRKRNVKIEEKFEEQVDAFYADSVNSKEEDESSESYWKRKKDDYNILFELFLRSRSICPSTACVESFFSSISRTFSSQKPNMSLSTLSTIMEIKYGKSTDLVNRIIDACGSPDAKDLDANENEEGDTENIIEMDDRDSETISQQEDDTLSLLSDS